jgi:predicted Zn-dependent protease
LRAFRITAVVLFALASLAAARPARADRAYDALQKLYNNDDLFRAGRVGQALAGYEALLREFPTWWLPALKAAVASRTLGLPAGPVAAAIERVATLSPEGRYLDLVRAVLEGEASRVPDSPPDGPAPDTVLDRLILVRARALDAAGRHGDAAAEYRRLLARTPGCQAGRFGLARALAALGETVEAARMLDEGASSSLFPPRWRSAAGNLRAAPPGRSDGEAVR